MSSMQEITRLSLDNDMDLVLVHKRTMKLGELAGLSLALQTTFATAVSEVARNVIEYGNGASLVLGIIADLKEPEKFLVAKIKDRNKNLTDRINEGLIYAKRLVDSFNIEVSDQGIEMLMYFKIPGVQKIISSRIEQWIISFNVEPPVSPYDEIKRKNKQLQELAEKLRESETQYKELTNSLPMIIFSMREDGELLYTNSWLEEFTGESLLQLNLNKWANIIPPEDLTARWELWYHNVAENKPHSQEIRLRSAHSGEYTWHQLSAFPLADENGRTLYWTGFIVNIHARKLMEQTLKDNQELNDVKLQMEDKVRELKRSNLELEQFAYAASHDLQEPLRKIVFYSDYLYKHYAEQIDERGQMYFTNMVGASQRMTQLINDLLNFSRIYHDNLHLEVTDLNLIAAEAVSDLEVGINAKQVIVEIASLPVMQVYPIQMRQLFQNLLSNAIKFSDDQRTPHVKIYAVNGGKDVQLIFEDNGVGFNEKYLDKMFSLFQRLHSREKYQGTGIGLAMCKKIADLHNGTISAKSEPGNGARFIVTLPKEA
jgi:PAS domain S-box-containing protein